MLIFLVFMSFESSSSVGDFVFDVFEGFERRGVVELRALG